jgi:cleavage stimulation factor subunit 1
VATFLQAHDGSAISSVAFSRNGKYVLSSGKDSLVKLWELSTSRCLIAYTGAGSTGKQVEGADSREVFNLSIPGAPGPGRLQPDGGLRDVS